jgi:hypothetical protein
MTFASPVAVVLWRNIAAIGFMIAALLITPLAVVFFDIVRIHNLIPAFWVIVFRLSISI